MATTVLSLRRAESSEGRKSALLYQLNASMDHALSTLLGADRPAFARPAPSTDDAAAAWMRLDDIVSSRKRELERKAQRAKAKAKKAPAAELKAEKAPRKLAKPSPKASTAAAHVPATLAAVKLLDLSGANLSPVLTHSTARADRLPPADLSSDVVAQLKALPMLETLQAGTKKCETLTKWVEADDGKNRALPKLIMTLIGKLQRDGLVPANPRDNGRKPGRRRSETLDERLIKEGEWNGRAGRRRRLPSTSRRPTKARNKRPLGGFIASDEEESDLSGEYSEEEGEYEGSSESEEAEVDFEVGALQPNDEEDDEAPRKRSPKGAANGSRSKKNTTSQTSPRVAGSTSTSASVEPSAAAASSEALRIKEDLSAKEQLARVTARLREVEQDEAATLSSQTYLLYESKKSPTSSSKKKSNDKPETPSQSSKSVEGSSISTSSKSAEGSSVSTAIVLEDSDEEEDDDAALVNTSAVPKAKPPTPPPTSKTPAPAAPAKPRNLKRKTEDDEVEDEEEEEDAAMEQAGSSTDEDQELFDLDDEDVYVVESLLEMRVGRTMVTNGRRSKEADLYLVKWEGYNELTWEPDGNIPKRLIQFYKEREAAKRACQFQIGEFLERRVAKNSTTSRDEIIYLIRWANQPQAYWEVRSNLPEKTVVWLEKTNRASQGKAVMGSSSRKKAKRNN
ncbi:hypothetical protein P43SY_000582 [Pythium insidiosum]|uniref:Chromo domain-containing protein n=1 Tax=Pythium insidiosum TaxID=114742 RepID=A0AAD5Q612_PYTIN|nr:hypothetical protein P43SY_000582 [Pythium insidiosum]